MITIPHITTPRLSLVQATLEILSADLTDRTTLADLLNATIPGTWPPPLLDQDALMFFIKMVQEESDPHFSSWYWILKGPDQEKGILIGSGGVVSHSEEEGTVMIGYSVLDDFQNLGYATEAVAHMIPVIFSFPGVLRILATTYPELPASVRVLEKNGFIPVSVQTSGEGMEEGTIAYVREKN
ncbi:MAG TPA: GNAT family N-acetyltransferase [Methanospirillum sp.]|nr:GNAT family N-acetyltransferase [Methanospirillum sp.]